MALVVLGVCAGDVICVFSGADTPHALRKHCGNSSCWKYQLIGDAYVHGWMDGSLFMDSKNKEQRFTII